MTAPAFYDQFPEVSKNIYDSVQKGREDQRGSALAVMHLPLAYLVATYVLFEGLFILLHGTPLKGMRGPFSESEMVFLYIVAWGDIIASIAGATAIWFSHNLMPLGYRKMSMMHAPIAKHGSGTLLAWRLLVCLSVAPWAGIALAFSSPGTDKFWMWILVCAYICLSIFIVYALILTFRQIFCDGVRLQEHIEKQALNERRILLRNAQVHNHWADCDAGGRDSEVEPLMFGMFELAPTVTLYTIVIAVACVWSWFHLILTGQTSGGWAFFSSTPHVDATFWWEVFLYPVSFAAAIIGFSGAATLSETSFALNENQSRSSMLIFFLSCIFRFGLLFAVTGMCFLEKNTCGFYLHGLSSIAYGSPGGNAVGVSIHCLPSEWLLLAGSSTACFLDAYLIWGTYKLYHHSHAWTFEQRDLNDEAGLDWHQVSSNQAS